MLAHKAEEDGVACVDFIAGKEGHVDYDMVRGVVYTRPVVTYVGKTEEQDWTLRKTEEEIATGMIISRLQVAKFH
ncbi:hypothetical protein BC332_31387 [Capsicum chinense]|nr:hypothetical protein BC332_31387 [Capsicum chinense]